MAVSVDSSSTVYAVSNPKPKLVLSEDNFETVVELAENGRLKELKQAIGEALRKRDGQNVLIAGEPHPPGEPGIIRAFPVIKAASWGSHETVKYFVDNFSDVVCSDFDMEPLSNTAVHSAVYRRRLQVLKVLVQAGVSVNCQSSDGRTPLHWLRCTFGQDKVVKYLLDNGADPNVVDRGGHTPLFHIVHRFVYSGACSSEQRKCLPVIVQLLLGNGAEISNTLPDGNTLLHELASNINSISQQLLQLLMQYQPRAVWELLIIPSTSGEYSELPALLYAAEMRNRPFVEFVASIPRSQHPAAVADALLGLSTNIFPYQIPTEMISSLWKKAFEIRNRYKIIVKVLPPEEEYGNRVEIGSLDGALQIITEATRLNDPMEVYFQLLLMRERIFGYGSRAVIQYLWEFAHNLCKQNHFAEADGLFIRAMNAVLVNLTGEYTQPGRYKSYNALLSTLDMQISEWALANQIQHMLKNNYTPNFRKYAEHGLEFNKHLLVRPDKVPLLQTDILYQSLALFGAWAYRESKLVGNGDLPEAITKMGCTYVTDQSLLTLLYLSTGGREARYIPSQEHEEYFLFMIDSLFQWAGRSGVNAMDANGNRPLHVAMSVPVVHPVCRHLSVKSFNVPSLLIEHGAHLDAVNSEGKTAYEVCSDPKVKEIIAPPAPSHLTCLACRAVIAGGIPYMDSAYVPPQLKRLLMLHDPDTERTDFIHSGYIELLLL